MGGEPCLCLARPTPKCYKKAMLAEILTYLTTPCPGYVREMGYLYEAIAVQGRYRRNRASWQPTPPPACSPS